MTSPEHIAYFLLKEVTRAIGEFAMIEDDERVAVAVSGGKDSRTMLELLQRHRRKVPYAYDLVALHVVGTPAGLPDRRPELEPWFQALDVAYRFVPLELPPNEPLPLDCFRCSWNRRKALFTAAHELGCQKLALGHHADDAAVTTLMNLMFSGQLETIEPCVAFFEGTITIIRPLIYLLEKEIARYAKVANYPEPIPCPQGKTSKRAQAAAFLRQFGRAQEQIRTNLWRAAREAMGF